MPYVDSVHTGFTGDVEALSVGAWGLVHGLAFLHLGGKLPPKPRAEVDQGVRSALEAVLSAAPAAHASA